jgi:hypothetical protein
MKACAYPSWARHRSRSHRHTVALPSGISVALTSPGRFGGRQRPVYRLVFLEPMRVTVAARSGIAVLSLLSKEFNARHSTKQRSARPGAG